MGIKRDLAVFLLTQAPEVINMLSSDASGVAKFARLIGLDPAKTTIEDVKRRISNDRYSLAVVLKALGTPTAKAKLIELTKFDPDLVALVDDLTADEFEDTTVGSTNVLDIGRFRDEFEAIDSVAAWMGGIERVVKLRRVLAMPDSTFGLYHTVKSLARRA